MTSHAPSLARGDVAACGNSRGVVWRISSEEIVLLPIKRDGGLHYRGDEAITEIGDCVQTGVAGLDLVVRVADACRVPSGKQIRIGRLSDRLLARVERAVDRECATAAVENRWFSR